MSWRVWSVRTSDWKTKVRVFPSTMPWARVLNAGAGGAATFNLGDPVVAETADPRTNLAPWSRMLVLEYHGIIVYAGFITATEYDKDTQTYTVTHEDFWALLARRIMVNILQFGVEKTTLVFANMSLPDLIKHALFWAQNDGARFFLPVTLPPQQGGTHQRTYKGYELPTTAAVIEDIINTEGGPDYDPAPRWFGEDQVEWFSRIGNLREGTWEWHVDAPDSPVTGLKERRDGSQMANRIAAIGQGSEKKMKVSVTDGSATSAFLPLDATVSYKNEDSRTHLANRVRADRAARERPTEQVSMDVQMGDEFGPFAVHDLLLGGTVKWHTQGDPYFADGWHTSRLIEYSGDLSNKIHLEFQTEGA